MARAATRIEAVYELPYLPHATMEPLNCTVHVRPDGCEVWTGSQVLSRAQKTAAEVTGLPFLGAAALRTHTIHLTRTPWLRLLRAP